MGGKVFGLLLAALAVAVAVALFHLSGDPPSDANGKKPPVTQGGEPTTPNQPPPKIKTGGSDPETTTPNVTRTELPDDVDVDHGATLKIRGRVTEMGTGEPIEDAEIEVLYPNGDDIAEGTSDANGQFEIMIEDGVPPVIAFRCWGDGYTVLGTVPRRVTRGQVEMTVDFELYGSYAIEGRVVSSRDGLPIEGADVEIRCAGALFQDDWDDAETDENGFFRIEDIEDLPREGIIVGVVPMDHAPMVKRDLSLKPGERVLRVDFGLYETLTITGKVVSKVTGLPIEDAMISVSSRDEEYEDDGEDEITEADGTFEMETDTLPLEGLYVVISAEDHAAVRIDPIPAPDASGRINVGQVALGGSVSIQGFVRNARNGTPVGGGDVYAYPVDAPGAEDSDYADEEIIDAQGRFEIRLEYATPDGFDLFVESDGFESAVQRVKVPPGALIHQVQVALEPVIVLRGTIFNKSNNQPVPGAMVRVLTQGDEDEELTGRTRANGIYRVEIPNSEDLARFSIVVEAMGQRFLMGAVGSPAGGTFEVVRDFVIDVPARR